MDEAKPEQDFLRLSLWLPLHHCSALNYNRPLRNNSQHFATFSIFKLGLYF
jgi:hypothetical protein